MSREGEADAVVREAKECVGVTELLTLKVNNEWSITEAEDALKAQEIPAVGNAQGWGWKLISALKGWYRGVMEVRLCCAPTGLKGFFGSVLGALPRAGMFSPFRAKMRRRFRPSRCKSLGAPSTCSGLGAEEIMPGSIWARGTRTSSRVAAAGGRLRRAVPTFDGGALTHHRATKSMRPFDMRRKAPLLRASNV